MFWLIFIQSSAADNLQKVILKNTDGDGCSSGSVLGGTCVCDTANGWAGTGGSSSCTNCWSQSLVVSADQCVSCNTKYGMTTGMVFSSASYVPYKCWADRANGYVGHVVSATEFDASYPLTQCWNKQLVQDDMFYVCITCNPKYSVTAGMIFNNSATYHCSIDTANGYIGQISNDYMFVDNIRPVLCWTSQQVVSSDGLKCISCNEKYSETAGLIYESSASYKCSIDRKNGYVGFILNASSFDGSYPLKNCWINQLVQDDMFFVCIICNKKYNVVAGLIFNESATYHCSIDGANGYIGQIADDYTFSTGGTPVCCWASKLVLSSDGNSCVSCNIKYKVSDGLLFDSSAEFHCIPDNVNGFVAVIFNQYSFSKILVNCWSTNQVVVNNECTSCYTISPGYVYDSQTYIKTKVGQCICGSIYITISGSPFTCSCDHSQNFVGIAGQCTECNTTNAKVVIVNEQYVCGCQSGFSMSNNICIKISESTTSKSVVAIAVAVPVAFVIAVSIFFIICCCFRRKKQEKEQIIEPMIVAYVPAVQILQDSSSVLMNQERGINQVFGNVKKTDSIQ
ncbi:Hypothetical_protein [Hexamita inflata]|uniref:Hypothetical_protein n=1 Tax=Hexamita inflata TaxID=28002 RepID=A0AA86UQA5_9EUKA|nr:Hypothetical protein HINF_LOCUS48167 [Hexamita inflata]